jgi:HlyD family secretion protein
MNKKFVIIIVTLVLVGAVAGGIYFRNRETFPSVRAVDVTAEGFSREVSANGEIVSKEHGASVAPVNGKVVSVPHEVGDRVSKGDILAKLDTDSLEADIENAELALESARMTVREELLSLRTGYTEALTAYNQAKKDYTRTKDLHAIGSAGDRELSDREDALKVAEGKMISIRQRLNFREGRPLEYLREGKPVPDADVVAAAPEVRQAEARLRSLRKTLAEYTIRAAQDGVLTFLGVDSGDIVSTGKTIATVHNPSALEVTVDIDEVDLSYIQVGQEARIESDSFIGKEIYGRVAKIAPIIRREGDTRVCEVRIDVTRDPEKLARIGAGCSIFITVEEKEGAPAIPVDSYFLDKGKQYVWVLSETEEEELFMVNRREVETGILGIESVEVVSGLAVGDRVIKGKNAVLADGDMVKLEEPEEKSKDQEDDAENGEEEIANEKGSDKG